MSTARRSSKRKVGATQNVSRHPSSAAKDATLYHIPFLLCLKDRNATFFDNLDFVNASDHVIERLIREPATADMGGYLCHYDRVSTYGPGHM